MKIDFDKGAYEPIIYLSDFWNLKKNMIQLNETLDESKLNLTLNFQMFWPMYFQVQQQFLTQHQQQEEWGVRTMDLNEMKRMWVETDKILLTVTMIVSCLHSVFEMLAFKHDITFWNQKESMEGISVKTLWF